LISNAAYSAWAFTVRQNFDGIRLFVKHATKGLAGRQAFTLGAKK
jgi:hypothetical protein